MNLEKFWILGELAWNGVTQNKYSVKTEQRNILYCPLHYAFY